MTFIVSMQPGNNYRAGASATQSAIDGATQTQADDDNPPQYVRLSEMLTVWRKLHVETDSMAAVTGNTLSTTFSDIVGSGTALTEIRGLSGLDDGSPNLNGNPPENGRFEKGKLVIGAGIGSVAIDPVTGNGFDRVVFPSHGIAGLPFSARDNDSFNNGTMSGTISQLVRLSSSEFVWVLNVTNHNEDPIDWPDFVGGTLSVGGGSSLAITAVNGPAFQLTTSSLSIPCTLHDDDDDTLLPKMPDTSTMVAAYQPAYVLPVFDVGDNNMNVPFVLNVADTNAAINPVLDWDSRGLNAPNFWVAYLLEAFQGQASDQDNDPNSEIETFGASPLPGGGSLIFLEIHQAHEGISNPPFEEQVTVVHETGHSVGNSRDHPVTANNDHDADFVANYLEHIRSSNSPAP